MKPPQRKILANHATIGIVNRGEAAVRFIRAVKEFNLLYQTELKTVALYLDVERDALFVKHADIRQPLSQLPAFAQNQGSAYLNKALLLEALQYTGCQGVWLGWGFVSENAEFVTMLEKAELAVLAPSAYSMSLLGHKMAAKKVAMEAEVPLLPWSEGELDNVAQARHEADKIGYPVMIKAPHAGGGRGIRPVRKPEEIEQQFLSAREESWRVTGKAQLFMEKMIEKARHLEVQVIADRHGQVQTLGVRDCSIQRRQQKVVEETPPVHLDKKILGDIQEAAARLMKAAAYESAGTVEFIYDTASGQFYFMEVNTRLQVEHPITEELYNVDLVKAQILVAMGHKLEKIKAPTGGCVIEVRLNAEDADKEFSPAPGRVSLCKPPSGPGIRFDSGFEEGSKIPGDFDSMVAKIIASGTTREETLARLMRALEELEIKIEGGTTNRAFLLEFLRSAAMREGGVHTRFLEEWLAGRQEVIPRHDWDVALVAYAIGQYVQQNQEEMASFQQKFARIGLPQGIGKPAIREVALHMTGHDYLCRVKFVGNHTFHINVADKLLTLRYLSNREHNLLIHDDRRYLIHAVKRGEFWQYEINSTPYLLEFESQGVVRSPSPAIVIMTAVTPGQAVEKGALLVTLEAMKMEMIVTAPKDGVVRNVLVQKGQHVTVGQPLIEMEASKDAKSKEIKPETPPISFQRLAVSPDTLDVKNRMRLWELLRREFIAIFLGFDYEEPAAKILKKLSDFNSQNPGFHVLFAQTLTQALEMYVNLERLFGDKQIYAEGFARPVNFQEFLVHFLRRTGERDKGLPPKFLEQLEQATRWYAWEGLEDDAARVQSLLHIYKSHACLAEKQELLRATLLSLQELLPKAPEVIVSTHLAALLDETIELSQVKNTQLADAAVQARYTLVDRAILEKMQEERRMKVGELVEAILRFPSEASRRDKLMAEIVDAGHYIVFEVVKLGCDQDDARRRLALELIARRSCRDRKFIAGQILNFDGHLVYQLDSADEEKQHETLITILSEKECRHKLQWLDSLKLPANKLREIVVLVALTDAKDEVAAEPIFTALTEHRLPAASMCIGICGNPPLFSYRTFTYQEPQAIQVKQTAPAAPEATTATTTAAPTIWKEDERLRYLSNLMCRELRVNRLVNFHLKLLYHSESVFLYQATAKSDPKDERFFALIKVAETYPDLDEGNLIQRMVPFETAFMEAVQALRREQVKRKDRLCWNRIIIHIRSALQTNMRQLQRYIARMSSRIFGLGLERLVVYVRTGDNPDGVPQETEFIIENSWFSAFSLRRRVPSQEPLLPMDSYTGKVVRALQRGYFYPYEFVKSITQRGSGQEKFPKGKFEEYDIEIDQATGKHQGVSVAHRPYGQNKCNIVFGLLTSFLPELSYPVERVIILGDPTLDMGSLAEGECRRVMAALDMAQQRQIPVEWIGISAGARIDMDSGTENLDWTAAALRRIIEFTQQGGEINIIVPGVNVGAQSYWNAEATMLMHTKGMLIMSEEGCMLLTGKKALDFSGSVSGEDNLDIGGVEKIMGPNGECQIRTRNLAQAYQVLLRHYEMTYVPAGAVFPERRTHTDADDRDVMLSPYQDLLGQGFTTIGDIFSLDRNPERKKPFDVRQVMLATKDADAYVLERWPMMKDAETAVVWETRIGGYSVGLLGVESRPLARIGHVPNDGPETWTGGTLFPQSSKKVARAINALSGKVPLVMLANLSGFDGSPESLRNCQLEFGAEIGRAVVNFHGPMVFVVIARHHGGAYVVFSKTLNPFLRVAALEGTFASVIGGAPAAAVVFPRQVSKDTYGDPRIQKAQAKLKEDRSFKQKEFDELFQQVYSEKLAALAQKFDQIHSVQRAQRVGSIADIVAPQKLRSYLIQTLGQMMDAYRQQAQAR